MDLNPGYVAAGVAALGTFSQAIIAWAAFRSGVASNSERLDRVEARLQDIDEFQNEVRATKGAAAAEHKSYEKRLDRLEERAFDTGG